MSFIANSSIFDLFVILVTVTSIVFSLCKWKLTFWQRKGVPTLSPSLPFGDAKQLILGQHNLGTFFASIYEQFKRKGITKHGGVYVGIKPFYIVIEPSLIKHVMQQDFEHFMNHGIYVSEEHDPLGAHLFNLEDEKWRNMRVKLTPTFTSGKMKMMFSTFLSCARGLEEIMNEAAETKTMVNAKDVLGRFTTDVIGSVAFGLECNSLKNPDGVFRKYGKKIFELDTKTRIKFLTQLVVPHSVLRFFKFKFNKPDVEEFFFKVVKDTVEYREKNNIFRQDFMHLLLQLKNYGTVTDNEKVVNENRISVEQSLTLNQLAAQAFVFFIAGFETSSTLMTFTLYELATHQDIQDKVREEINTVLNKYNGEISYEAVMSMPYMEQVLQEVLRLYPPVPFLLRKCSKDYTVPNTSLVIRKGTNTIIPIMGIHRDFEYYPNPSKFNPENFATERKHSRPSFTWLPFGEGPRLCIGLRFGLMQSRVGLITLLRNYKVTLNTNTQTPIELAKDTFVSSIKGDLWLDVAKLN